MADDHAAKTPVEDTIARVRNVLMQGCRMRLDALDGHSTYLIGDPETLQAIALRLAENDSAVSEAVREERERVEGLCQALRYRMNASDFDTLIVAIRKEPDHD